MKVRFDCQGESVILEQVDTCISPEDRKLIEDHLTDGFVYSKGRSPDGKRRPINAENATAGDLVKAIKEDDERCLNEGKQAEARQRYEETCRLNNITPEPAD